MRRCTAARWSRTGAAVAVALAPALLLAGCGGDEPAASPGAQESSAQSSPSSPSAPSSAAPSGTPVDPAALVADMRRAMRDEHSVHVQVDLNAASGALSAEGDVAYRPSGTGDLQMRLSMPSVSAQDVELRRVDGVLYLSAPPMTPDGKWVRAEPGHSSGPLAGLFGGVGDQVDPLRSLEAFRTGLREARLLGTETVDGEQLRHYVLTVETRAGLKALGQEVPSGLPDTLTYDLWLDGNDLMRRLTLEQSGLSLDMRMSGWGEPVQVAAPDPSAVVR